MRQVALCESADTCAKPGGCDRCADDEPAIINHIAVEVKPEKTTSGVLRLPSKSAVKKKLDAT